MMVAVNGRYVAGERGGQLLLVDNYIYKRNKRKNGKYYYRCNVDGCNLTLVTFSSDIFCRFGRNCLLKGFGDGEEGGGGQLHSVKKN